MGIDSCLGATVAVYKREFCYTIVLTKIDEKVVSNPFPSFFLFRIV
ncbi:unnamed protein product [Brassica rapa subsp. narinosa]